MNIPELLTVFRVWPLELPHEVPAKSSEASQERVSHE